MSWDVVVLVAGEPAADPFAAEAARGAERLAADGARVDLRVGVPERMPRDGRVTICHGIQFADLVREEVPGKVVLGDVPSGPLPPAVTAVDWCWDEAARTAGTLAGSLPRVGFVAGPPVPTQRRVLRAFADGAQSTRLTAVHLSAFDAVGEGARLGTVLAADLGCVLVAHSADAAGDAATEAARAAGAETFGFLTPHPDDVGWVRSDIAGVVAHLGTSALDGRVLPPVFAAGLASGFGGFALAAAAPEAWRERLSAVADLRRPDRAPREAGSTATAGRTR
jgi:hypothetical protein